MKDLLRLNAEFAKNVWMEFSIQRLIAMPIIIFIVMGLVASSDSSESTILLHYSAMAGYVLIGMLWGIKTSSESILDEYNDKTWDWQKMSILGAWKLTIGKLFGSTLYNWYGAAICWVIFMCTTNKFETEYMIGVYLIIITVMLHSLMLILSLQQVRKADGRTKIKSNQNYIIGIVLVSYFLGIIFSFKENLTWYGITTEAGIMPVAAALFYCAWAVAGVYRTIRAELQYSDTPLWWFMFIITNIVFQYGFFVKEGASGTLGFAACLGLMAIELLILCYILALSESKDIVNFRALFNALKEKRYKFLLQNSSLWMLTFPVAFLLAIIAFFFYLLRNESSGGFSNDYYSTNDSAIMLALLFSIFSFAIRDLGILLLLNFSGRSKRADAAMLVYLFILYGLFATMTKGGSLGAFFFPDITANPFALVLFPQMEACIVIFFLVRQWQKVNRV
jgi:hypothetical protein